MHRAVAGVMEFAAVVCCLAALLWDDPLKLGIAAVFALLALVEVIREQRTSTATVTPLSSSDRLPRRAAALTPSGADDDPRAGIPTRTEGWPWSRKSDATP